MEEVHIENRKTSPARPTHLDIPNIEDDANTDSIKSNRISVGSVNDVEEDTTVHPFNSSNITVIEVSDRSAESEKSTTQNDGSDSGVEVGGTNVVFKRALSSNSGGYSSSCGGAEDCNLVLSCDSSIISCCSNYEDAFDALSSKTSTLLEDLTKAGDRTSENGSESSSITGGHGPKSSLSSRRANGVGTVKKRVALTEPVRQSVTSRGRSVSTESPSTPRSPRSRTLLSRTDKLKNASNSTPRAHSTEKYSHQAAPRLSLPNSKQPKSNAASNKQVQVKRDLSSSRNKIVATATKPRSSNVSTPTDDGRWPSTGLKPTPTTMSRSIRGTLDSVKSRTPNDIQNKTIEKYATLPRRRREKTPEARSREASLTRSPVPKKNTTPRETITKYLPNYSLKRKQIKTKIYHETSIQTALTATDMDKISNGNLLKLINPEEIEKSNCGVQVDLRHEIVEKLESKLKELTIKYEKLNEENTNKTQRLQELEEQVHVEQDEKNALKNELERNTQRVMAILHNNYEGTNQCEDSLLVLESQFQKAGEIVVKQEQEISELQSLCRTLQRDLDKSLQTQRNLIQQQNEMEAENSELQEFMQAEKSTLAEVLRETEDKVDLYKDILRKKDIELSRQQDECQHLVRVSEQRRQENLTLQARLGALEARSRDLLLQQGAAVSGAAVALSGLSSRLDGLVNQLIATYNISDQDLEVDVPSFYQTCTMQNSDTNEAIYHNEAYSVSESSDESVEKTSPNQNNLIPERTPSPKRGASFVSAVINAIKNAAAHTSFTGGNRNTNGNYSSRIEKHHSESDTSDSAELLDSETEPILMMENVLEDVTLPDTHSHNMVSSGSHSLMSASRLGHSESLQNLSQAIISRQEQEKNLQKSMDQMTASLSEYCPALTLIDQVIDVDNLVTKLLKVLRIIQIENDNYVEELLQDERSQFSEKLQKQRENCTTAIQQLREWESMSEKLKVQLSETTKQLTNKTRELEDSKQECLKQRKDIERLNEDICKLSQLCNQAEMKLRNREEEANETLKQWEQTGKLPSAEVMARLVTARHEIPALKEKLKQKEKELKEISEKYSSSHQAMTESWSQAVNETRRQYEAIDNALETLLSIQNIVEKCPPLAKLQHDLEETSFHCASSIPYVIY